MAMVAFTTVLWWALAFLVAWWAWSNVRPAHDPMPGREKYSVHYPHDGRYKHPKSQVNSRPGEPLDETPLFRAVRKAIDTGANERANSHRGGDTGRAAPYTHEEMVSFMHTVVRRINAQDDSLDLHGLSVNGVRKTSFGDLHRIEADIDVHDKARMSASLSVRAEVRGGHMRIVHMRVRGADTEPADAQAPFLPTPSFAEFKPVAAYRGVG